MTLRLAPGYVLCREVQDLDRAARSASICAPIQYRLTGDADRDQLFIARVEACGPGGRAVARGVDGSMCATQATPTVGVGDLIAMNQSNISYRIHRLQRPYFAVQYQYIAATIDPEDFRVKPLGPFVLVRPADERAQRSMRGNGKIWLAESDAARTDDIGHGQGILAAYGEVIAKGPGCWDEGAWLEAPCEKGDLVLYDRSHSTLPVRIRGEAFVLVAARQIVMAETDEDVCAPTLPPEQQQEQTPRAEL